MEGITIKKTPSFNVQIWCGLKAGYNGYVYAASDAEEICKKFVDEIGQCVSITKTNFVYTNGAEPGFVVGFINYPRFPMEEEEIKTRAIDLAKLLMIKFKQNRVTITTPHESIMIENEKQE